MLIVHMRKTNETQNSINTIDNSEQNNLYMNAGEFKGCFYHLNSGNMQSNP